MLTCVCVCVSATSSPSRLSVSVRAGLMMLTHTHTQSLSAVFGWVWAVARFSRAFCFLCVAEAGVVSPSLVLTVRSTHTRSWWFCVCWRLWFSWMSVFLLFPQGHVWVCVCACAGREFVIVSARNEFIRLFDWRPERRCQIIPGRSVIISLTPFQSCRANACGIIRPVLLDVWFRRGPSV